MTRTAGESVIRWVACTAVAAVLVIHVPAFLCLGLDSDVSMWDLCARNVLQGGVAYRDAVENNFPGMLWLHLGIRSLAGWCAAAIRLADLAVLAGIVVLLLRWLPSGGALRPVTALLLLSFYLSTSEWCHCQRDTWMLLPALLALDLRRRQVTRLSEGESGGTLFSWAFLEGLCWAAAVWIKPFAGVPALLCWLVSVVLVARGVTQRRGLKIDLTGLLAGGLAAGAAGVAWLRCTGAWPSFVAIVFDWNRAYAAEGYAQERLPWLAGVLVRLLPGSLVHLLALPVALEQLGRGAGILPAGRSGRQDACPTNLLAALYCGWVVQAFCLQQPFDYIHAPAVLLGLALVAARWPALEAPLVRWSLAAFALVCLAVQQRPLIEHRLDLWSRCWCEGGSAELRDRLALNDRNGWRELEQVAEFLRQQGVEDGEVTCYTVRTLPLYLMLDRKPSTRFYALESTLVIYRGQRDLIRAELAASRQKYIVCDLYWMQRTEAELTRPAGKARTVLNTGRYLVLRLDAADTPPWLAVSFGL
jgi:hypothetical protein